MANGGTGQTTYTDGQLLIGNTTGNTLTKATLTAGTGVTITNAGGSITIAASSGSGTVTSVDLSAPAEITVSGNPITTSGTIALAWATETTNKVFATPNGSTGTLRHAVDGPLPQLAKEIVKSDPNGARLLIGSLGLLAQELQAAVDGGKGQAQTEAAGPESKSKRQRRAAESTG